jgi:general secretion pathway protein D
MPANLCSRLFILAVILLAGPRAAAQDLLQQFKRQQEIYAQKVEAELNAALTQAQRLLATEPVKAVELLKQTLTKIEADANLTGDRKDSLVRVVKARLRMAEIEAARPAPPEPKAGPAVTQQAIAQQQARETEEISKTLAQIHALQRDGRSAEANRMAQDLLKQYPNQMAALGAGRIQSVRDVVVNARTLRTEANNRVLANQAAADRSALPPSRDVEFPADWKDRVAKRTGLNGPPLTDKEKVIMKSLATPITVGFNDERFEDIIGKLADLLNQPILLDKESLADAQVTSDTTYSLRELKNVPARTILRKVLGDLGLAYVIKDETIQVLTRDRAARETVTKTYYIGDLLAGGMFNQAGVRFVPWVDQLQAMQNVNTIIQMIQNIDPPSWQGNGGFGTISFHAPTMSLIVKQTAELHNMIGGSLR